MVWIILLAVFTLCGCGAPLPKPETTSGEGDVRLRNELFMGTGDSSLILNQSAAAGGGYVFYRLEKGNNYYIIREPENDPAEAGLLVSGVQPAFLSVSREWLYFVDGYDRYSLKRADINGNGIETVVSGVCIYPVITADGTSVIFNDSGSGNIVRKDMISGERTIVADDTASDIALDKDRLFYINMADEAVYSINIDGSGRTKLVGSQVRSLKVSGDCLYYLDAAGNEGPGIYRMALNQGGAELVLSRDVYSFDISEDYLFYADRDDGYSLKRFNMKTGEFTLIAYDNLSYVQAVGGRLYYVSDNENGALITCGLDGGNRTALTDK